MTSKDIWQKALDTLGSTRRQTVILALAGLVIPELLSDLWFDFAGSAAALRVREVFESGRAGSFLDIAAPALAFAAPFFAVSLVIVVLILGTYLALMDVAVRHLRGMPMPKILPALGQGIVRALVRLPGTIVVLMFLGMAGQVLVAPAILMAALLLVAPVVAVAEGKGALRASTDTVTLKYVRGSPFSSWGVMFHLLSLGATFYVVLMIAALISDQVLTLDQKLPALRGFWDLRFGDLPFGPVYLAVSVGQSLALTLVLAVMPAVTSALYFTVVAKRELARA